MSEPAPKRMTSDEFLAWAMEQPEGYRYELVAGEIVGMAPERAAHTRTKGRIYSAAGGGDRGIRPGLQSLPGWPGGRGR